MKKLDIDIADLFVAIVVVAFMWNGQYLAAIALCTFCGFLELTRIRKVLQRAGRSFDEAKEPKP